MTYETNALALAGAAYDKARERDAQVADLTRRVDVLEFDAHRPFDFAHLIARLDALEKTVAILPADPVSGEGANETEPPKIIPPGNALWAFGLAEEEVKRLRAENAGLRATLEHISFMSEANEQDLFSATQCAAVALANPTGVEGMDAPNHIMCIGWETIKRLAAGEAVWIESIQAGAVAADDLLGVDIDALLAPRSDPANGEGKCPIGLEADHWICSAGTCEVCQNDLRKQISVRDAENATLRAKLAEAKGALKTAENEFSDINCLRMNATLGRHNDSDLFELAKEFSGRGAAGVRVAVAALASPNKLESPALCNYEPHEPVGECKVDRCRRLGYCPWASKQP